MKSHIIHENDTNNSNKDRQSILLPPPNITGKLHMGHAFQQTLMDIICKFNIMHGIEIDWYPGTDHAGIAGQMAIEKQLGSVSRVDMTYDLLLEEGYKCHLKHSSMIRYQMQRMGFSVNWNRERFTMDPGFQEAVKHSFIALYNAGFLYRKDKLVFWDPKFQTAISDSEVVYQERSSSLWYLIYPLINSKGHIRIATTRPETLFGDVALAVNPNDIRFNHLIGEKVLVPICNNIISIIGDDSIDMEFGTGCVKVSPGHDFHDNAIAATHNLPIISILDKNLRLNEHVPYKYRGLTIKEARKHILEDLFERDYIDQEMMITHKVPTGERSGEVLEPTVTKQWFIKSKQLVHSVIKSIVEEELILYPDYWQENFLSWLRNMEDWCISRQIWWGHRIPVWYDEYENPYVGLDEDDVRSKLEDKTIVLIQDQDVLDTWYTAALWPLVILGWPNTDVKQHTYLITGFDILFFWVIRMTMITKFLVDKVPATNIIITGLIRDQNGKKMSKTLGNVIDPLDIVDGISLAGLLEKNLQDTGNAQYDVLSTIKKNFPNGIPEYGPDVLRLTFAQLSTPSVTASFDFTKLIGNNAFINKLINASRFTFMYLEDYKYTDDIVPENMFNVWIINNFIATRAKFDSYIREFRFDLALKTLQDFIIHKYCDWFIEFVKTLFKKRKIDNNNYEVIQEAKYTMIFILFEIIQTLYPIAPFVSQNIYTHVNKFLLLPETNLEQIQAQRYRPVAHDKSDHVDIICNIIKTIRSLNSKHKQHTNIAFIVSDNLKILDLAKENEYIITQLTRMEVFFSMTPLIYEVQKTKYRDTISIDYDQYRIHIFNSDLKFQENNNSITQALLKERETLLNILNNVSFIEKAPKDVVNMKRKKLNEVNKKLDSYK